MILFYQIGYLIIYYYTKLQLLLTKKLPELTTEVVNEVIVISHRRNKRVIFADTSNRESHAKFIYAEIITSHDRKEIHFKTDQYNYFVIGNVFDKRFIRFFLKRHYGRELDDYCLSFIDHDMNDRVVCSNQTIRFLEYGYEIN